MPSKRIHCCKMDSHYHQVRLSDDQLFFLKAEMEALASSNASNRRKALAHEIASRCVEHLKHWTPKEHKNGKHHDPQRRTTRRTQLPEHAA